MTNLPLYRKAAPQPADAMHHGLWFDRFFDAFSDNFNDIDHSQRNIWLNRFSHRSVGDKTALRAKALHMRSLAGSRGGQARIYHCASNFVTGLGNPHPLENGFTWHHTLATPYLPGSAVKGLVRAVIETAFQGEEQNRHALLQRWFGTAEKGDVAERAGCFIFLDALPVQPCQLHVEVMTPHMGKWYEKGRKNPLAADTQPGDWHAPVPVTYLVARGVQLQFVILPLPGTGKDAQDLQKELQDLWHTLDHGLQWLGAGAKTAIGFGTMLRDDKARSAENALAETLHKQQHQARMQTLSAAMQAIATIEDQWKARHQQMRGKKENLNATIHNQARELAKKAHETADWSAEEKLAAARVIEEWVPKLVNNLDAKELRKQLKLGALKGNS